LLLFSTLLGERRVYGVFSFFLLLVLLSYLRSKCCHHIKSIHTLVFNGAQYARHSFGR
jgi:hypothetical protein